MNEIIINEPIADTIEEIEIRNTDTDSKCDVRFTISERLPALVGYNLSSFGDICTKGCEWSPSGEKLLVAAEDARKIFSLDLKLNFKYFFYLLMILKVYLFKVHRFFGKIRKEIYLYIIQRDTVESSFQLIVDFKCCKVKLY